MRIEIGKTVGRPGAFLLLAAIVAVTGPAVEATKIRHVNLEEMTERAATIFHGRCTEVREVEDPELDRTVTLATFRVERAVKGNPGQTVTVRMLGGAEKGSAVVGMPGFRPGEQVILFLYGESAAGLSSPVGFGQGKFSVVEDKLGRQIAVNEMGNRNLLDGVSPRARSRVEPSLGAWRDGDGLDPTKLLDMVSALKE